MELIKWVLSATVALTIALLGVGLAIGVAIFAMFLKIVGIVGFITAALTVMAKEKIDESSVK